MVRRILALGLLGLAGCLPEGSSTQLVPANPFGNGPVIQPPRQISCSPASEEAATRVGLAGEKLIRANPQLGARPLFRTIGAPQAEIFHVGTSELYVTEGLVKQCATEGQLAAVLSVELGKLVAEREALAGPQIRSPDRLPPADVRIGNDVGGTYGAADLTHLAELGKYERERGRPGSPIALPNPQEVARTCLMRAGYNAVELEGVAPLLQKAGNSQLQKQLTTPAGPARPWTK